MSKDGEGEFDHIRTHLRPLAAGAPGALNLSDDAALLDPPPGHQLVAASDMLTAGRHFLTEADPRDAAWKALAANLSDLAAMGADPLGYLCATAWPEAATGEDRAGFAAGLGEAQRAFGVSLLGGDTTSTSGVWTIAITALGAVPAGEALRRNGAKAGDDVYVSGAIGEAAVGLSMARGDIAAAEPVCLQRYRRPQPRLELGQRLRGLASACIDISDGLCADLGHIAETSQVGLVLEGERIPLGNAAALASLEALISGGDDYELAFTAGAENRQKIRVLSETLDIPIERIGRVEAGAGVRVLDRQGGTIAIDRPGFTHF